jgi:hypothetical protein
MNTQSHFILRGVSQNGVAYISSRLTKYTLLRFIMVIFGISNKKNGLSYIRLKATLTTKKYTIVRF